MIDLSQGAIRAVDEWFATQEYDSIKERLELAKIIEKNTRVLWLIEIIEQYQTYLKAILGLGEPNEKVKNT